jgi:hypothetical protein
MEETSGGRNVSYQKSGGISLLRLILGNMSEWLHQGISIFFNSHQNTMLSQI